MFKDYLPLEHRFFFCQIAGFCLLFTTQSWLLTTLKKSLLETLWEKEKILVTSIFSFSHNVFYPSQNKFHCFIHIYYVICKWFNCGVGGREVVLASQSWGPEFMSRGRVATLEFFIGPHIRHEYWCSSLEAELREINISCKNLFLNWCKINMIKLKLWIWTGLKFRHLIKSYGISPHKDRKCLLNWQFLLKGRLGIKSYSVTSFSLCNFRRKTIWYMLKHCGITSPWYLMRLVSGPRM